MTFFCRTLKIFWEIFCPYNGNQFALMLFGTQSSSPFEFHKRKQAGWTIHLANIKHYYGMADMLRQEVVKHWKHVNTDFGCWVWIQRENSSTAQLDNMKVGIQTHTFHFGRVSFEFSLLDSFLVAPMTKEHGNNRLQSTLATPTVTILKNHQESSHVLVSTCRQSASTSCHVWGSSHKVCSINQSIIQQGTVQSYFRTGFLRSV